MIRRIQKLKNFSDESQFESEVEKLHDIESMPGLVDALNNITPEQLQILEQGFGNGQYADKMDVRNDKVAARQCFPTQREIDVKKSLAYPLACKDPNQVMDILNSGPVKINLPIILYDYRGTYYVIDGHHRWSQVFLLNPNCTIDAIIFSTPSGSEIQDPADMLRDFQGAIAVANQGEVPSNVVESGFNMYEWNNDQLGQYIDENITDALVDVYRSFYNSEVTKYDIISSILSNFNFFKKSYLPVENAPSRSVMPQTDYNNNAGLEVAMQGMTDI